jgi:CubicO group peptidase (beta-lactamase class C family)
LQLVEQGKVNLSDPISKYYKNAPPSWDKITIDNLLTHRSGIPEYTITNNFLGTLARLDQTPESIMNTVRDKPLDFEPGTKYKYDNTGYVILGYIVEQASGESYPDYLRNHIFRPLGMSHTGYDIDGNILPHRAAGYVKEGSQWRNASFIAMSVPFAGGGLYSDVQDLITWDDALHLSRLLKPMSEKAMFTDHGDKYGYGVVIDQEKGRVSWHHSGVINGFHGYLVRYPDQHLTVALLSNYQGAPVETIAGLLTDLAFGETVNLDAVDAPRPGNEAAVRRVISQFQSGTIDFTQFDPQLAAAIRPRADTTVQTFRGYGALKSLKFGGRDDDGMDFYIAVFQHGEKEFHIYVDTYGIIRGLTLKNPLHS